MAKAGLAGEAGSPVTRDQAPPEKVTAALHWAQRASLPRGGVRAVPTAPSYRGLWQITKICSENWALTLYSEGGAEGRCDG